MNVPVRSTFALNQFVRTDEIEWQQLHEPGVTGVFVKVLRYDEATRRAPTILLKFDAGATYPAHNHPGARRSLFWRVIFVLAKTLCEKAITCTRRPTINTPWRRSEAVSCWQMFHSRSRS